MPATLKSRLPEIAISLTPRVKAAMRLGAEGISQEAKMRVPVDTGALKNAIHVESEGEGWSVIAGDQKAFYGHIIENGSIYTPPHPFLVPALESQVDTVLEAVNVGLRRL